MDEVIEAAMKKSRELIERDAGRLPVNNHGDDTQISC